MVSQKLNYESAIEVKKNREVKKYLVAALKKTKKFCETNLRKHTTIPPRHWPITKFEC